MQLDGRVLHWPLAAKQLVSRLEGEDPDHLGCAKETMRLLGVACACERTGSHAVAEPNVWDRNPLVQTLPRAEFQTVAILPIKIDDPREIRPQESAVCEIGRASCRGRGCQYV